jgi:hypothetical protein
MLAGRTYWAAAFSADLGAGHSKGTWDPELPQARHRISRENNRRAGGRILVLGTDEPAAGAEVGLKPCFPQASLWTRTSRRGEFEFGRVSAPPTDGLPEGARRDEFAWQLDLRRGCEAGFAHSGLWSGLDLAFSTAAVYSVRKKQ